jgi:ATP-dependent Lon protease
LRGEVLPIGGLKEKLLAAHRGGITTVLIPDDNTKDLAEIPANIKEKLDIRSVKWIDEVLQVALPHVPVPLPAPTDQAKPAEAIAGEKKRRAGRAKSQVRAH